MNTPYRNNKDELCITFGNYSVVQHKKDYNAIYNIGKFVTHETSWKKATKIAKMLNEAYREGYADGCY